MGDLKGGVTNQLEDENRKLKQLVADLSLDKHILQDVLAKKALTPGRQRETVAHVQASHGVSERCGCPAIARRWSTFAQARPGGTQAAHLRSGGGADAVMAT